MAAVVAAVSPVSTGSSSNPIQPSAVVNVTVKLFPWQPGDQSVNESCSREVKKGLDQGCRME